MCGSTMSTYAYAYVNKYQFVVHMYQFSEGLWSGNRGAGGERSWSSVCEDCQSHCKVFQSIIIMSSISLIYLHCFTKSVFIFKMYC